VKPKLSKTVFLAVQRGIAPSFSSILFQFWLTVSSVGYVEFRNPGSVAEAISMTGQRLLGLPIIVSITEAEKNRQARLDAMTS
jgi:hypothetical protein